MRWTITRRVVWAVTATVALLVGVLAVLAAVAMHEQEDALTDSMLNDHVHEIEQLTLRPGLMEVGSLRTAPHVTAHLSRGAEGLADTPAHLRGRAPGLYQIVEQGRTEHVAITDTEDGRLVVVVDASASEQRVHRFGLTMFALWALCVVVTAVIARAVAAIAVAPIVEATKSIARLAPPRPTGHVDPHDEAGILMETFNRFRDRVDETVAREREFAANLEHEIRTPLTTIRTDAELIAVEGPVVAAQQQRLERIVAAVDEIVATTRSALSSSAGRAGAPEAVDLRDCVVAACDSLVHRSGPAGLEVVVDIASGDPVIVDAQALLVVCRNLVRNAIEHAAPATLRIEGDARAIVFRDDGPGIDAALLAHLFEREHSVGRQDTSASEDGRRGLGLAIVRRLCQLQGWRLDVASPASGGRGCTFRLELGQATSG